MAQYFTDFGEYPVSQAPSDWTKMNTVSTPLIESSAWGVSGKHMKLASVSTARSAMMWDAVNADPDRADFEIYMRCRPLELGVSARDARFGLAGRIVGDVANSLDFGDWVSVSTSGENSDSFWMEFQNGSGMSRVLDNPTTQPTMGFFPSTLTVSHIKIRVSGSNFKVKCWQDPSPEPDWQGDWNMPVEAPTAPGNIGIYDRYSEFEVDYFSVGTGADAAPMPATPSTVTVTNVTDGTDRVFEVAQTGIQTIGTGFGADPNEPAPQTIVNLQTDIVTSTVGVGLSEEVRVGYNFSTTGVLSEYTKEGTLPATLTPVLDQWATQIVDGSLYELMVTQVSGTAVVGLTLDLWLNLGLQQTVYLSAMSNVEQTQTAVVNFSVRNVATQVGVLDVSYTLELTVSGDGPPDT